MAPAHRKSTTTSVHANASASSSASTNASGSANVVPTAGASAVSAPPPISAFVVGPSQAPGITPFWNPIVVLVFLWAALFLALCATAVCLFVRGRRREARAHPVRRVTIAGTARARGKAVAVLANGPESEKGGSQHSGGSRDKDREGGDGAEEQEQDLSERQSVTRAGRDREGERTSPPPPAMPLGLPSCSSSGSPLSATTSKSLDPGQESQTTPVPQVLVWLPSFRNGAGGQAQASEGHGATSLRGGVL
ncbi:hypothetical protein DICSQDRAFT_140063 [Dichomitus squalens LYAD-421 SS1]|uniref:Uncharacterized protein n=1 Tax=Dichomitus squalens (strain LYAD-421) TaxID=732165 RepID=R7SPD2_DICSQ|nr:uncharacterized protein DICSQDRAFT_140063 [Dichomitus squalens LYAD-421 SS1]EJF57773.1 hypothetical protein DICSQDRAFT_140063 [Dichomitus squalens LYAD-421 SS1]